MSEPIPALRGAVDLSSLGAPAPSSAPATGAPGGSPVLVEATDATFEQILSRTASVPAVGVVWSSQHPESKGLLDDAVALGTEFGGRLQVVSIDISTNPALAQALRPEQVPLAIGLLAGQALPLLVGLPDKDQFREVLNQLLTAAVQNGITGRLAGVDAEAPEEADEAGVDEADDALPPLHQEAYDAIERDDLAAAAAAFEKAVAQDPSDSDAVAGLGQVRLMERTKDVDLQAARTAAADDPSDIGAALQVADLDVLGGHVEDAFTRLIDLVKVTAGEDRDRVREHLVGLFELVGPQDERVRKGRNALMSALF